jgi:hypothetical protein
MRWEGDIIIEAQQRVAVWGCSGPDGLEVGTRIPHGHLNRSAPRGPRSSGSAPSAEAWTATPGRAGCTRGRGVGRTRPLPESSNAPSAYASYASKPRKGTSACRAIQHGARAKVSASTTDAVVCSLDP